VPARIDRLLLAVLAALAPCLVAAQASHWPTPSDIDRALKASPFPSADRIRSQPVPLPPRLDPKGNQIDIESLARRKIQLPNAGAASGSDAVRLRIFITLDMPRASLHLLTDQASRAGAVLVLRGLKSQSMRETLALVSELIGSRAVAWIIDPEAFTRFGVNKAPTFVVSLNDAGPDDAQRGCSGGCATPATFVSVAGDVSLGYALEAMLRRRPEAAPLVEPILKRLRRS
jgi:conjugal transfer pilus assembly protein TrbC